MIGKVLQRLQIAGEAKFFIVIMFFIILFLGLILQTYLPLFMIIFIFFVYFFREPLRIIPADPDSIVSPTSGRITNIDVVNSAMFGGRPVRQVEFKLSLFDVHIQRYPYNGRVDRIISPQEAISRFLQERRSWFKKSNFILIESEKGFAIGVRQMTGLITKRIICNASVGKNVNKGDKLGLIVFGSQVNLYLPVDIDVVVKKGDRVIDGETIIARLE